MIELLQEDIWKDITMKMGLLATNANNPQGNITGTAGEFRNPYQGENDNRFHKGTDITGGVNTKRK